MKTKLIALSLIAVLMVGVIAPSATGRAQAAAPLAPTVGIAYSHPAFLDKTRFLLHVGVAYYAFHHFVWARYKSGQLDLHHKVNLVKAGIALLFAYHELKVAYNIANSSNSKVLHLLIAPLNIIVVQAQTIGTKLQGGSYNAGDVTNFNNKLTSFGQTSAANGYSIVERSVPVPGA